jgi:histidine ammonia-lyase
VPHDPSSPALLAEVRRACPPLTDDRPVGPDIERVATLLRETANEGRPD